MKNNHPQEKIIESFSFNGVVVDVVEWTDTIWCGKIGYAVNNVDEPDVDKIMDGFQALKGDLDLREEDWAICMSVNYLSAERPNGVMFGLLVNSENQADEFDVYKVPAAKYMRISMENEIAIALDCEPWQGGIPPYKWIGEKLAPKFGYKYGSDTSPIFEYYGYYNPEKSAHEFCCLYVPVEKN